MFLFTIGVVSAQTFPPFYLDSYYNPENYDWGIWDILIALAYTISTTIIFIVVAIFSFRVKAYGRFRKVSSVKKRLLEISSFLCNFPELTIHVFPGVYSNIIEGPFQEALNELKNVSLLNDSTRGRMAAAIHSKPSNKRGRVSTVQVYTG